MLRLRDIKEYLHLRGSKGATQEDIEEHFLKVDPTVKVEDIKRLIKSGVGFFEIVPFKVRGRIKYFHENIRAEDIVNEEYKPEFTKLDARKKTLHKKEEIPLTDKMTPQEKIDAIMESSDPITKMLEFDYRENISEDLRGKDLYDFLHQGFCDLKVKIVPSPANSQKKTKIVSKRYGNNSVLIGRNYVGKWIITKTDCKCPERKETIEFESYAEMEKCLRTLNR